MQAALLLLCAPGPLRLGLAGGLEGKGARVLAGSFGGLDGLMHALLLLVGGLALLGLAPCLGLAMALASIGRRHRIC